jgi:GNAT superfamily N-acetyltransferase
VLGIDTHPDLDRRITYQWYLNRGYEVDCEECIWWRALAPFEPDALPDGLELRRAGPELAGTFAQVLNVGFGYAQDYVRGQAFAAAIGRPGWFHYVAFVDGAPAAASAMFVHDQVADCFVAATLPNARGRGAQTALIQRRLADGAAAGCDLATAQSVVTNASPRNFARQGFHPVYRRWIYGKRLVND